MSITETVARDRIVSRLKELELPTHEALAYITLLTHPRMTAAGLCKETGIPDSKIYYALDGLSKKGMLLVQRGNPNIYMPTAPKDAIANLKNQLTESLNEKIKEADALMDMLTPMYESAEGSEELEIAYIVRGQKNVINRMKSLIETAREEITIFIAYPDVFKELKEALSKAKEKRKVRLNIAMTQDVFEMGESSDLGEIRLLHCSIDSLGMLISDMKTLLTVSNWTDGAALLTQDQNLIMVTKDYFDSPSCCTIVSQSSRLGGKKPAESSQHSKRAPACHPG
jgi:sugar-specific transcriptional regulator TrmB